MKNNVYTLYNRLSNRYGQIFSFPSDGFALARLVESGIRTDEEELCRIGTVSIETGVVEPCEPVRIAWPEKVENMPVNNV